MEAVMRIEGFRALAVALQRGFPVAALRRHAAVGPEQARQEALALAQVRAELGSSEGSEEDRVE